EEKAAEIAEACQTRDLGALIALATHTHGLVNDSLRRTAWPLLLGCDHTASQEQPASWRELPVHRDEGQVALDVNRAFVYYPHESEKQLDRRKEELSNVIIEVLRRYPSLCYFQGYHDIVQVFLLVLGAQDAPPAVARLSLLRIRDFMLPTLDPAVAHLQLLPSIIRSADPELYDHLPKVKPFFALGGTITMFAHNIQAYGEIARLYDFFLARDTVMPVYFFAAVLLSRRETLFMIEKEEVDVFHVVLGKLPQPLDLESLISQSLDLYACHPPQSLPGWSWFRVSSSSVLKATRTPSDVAKMTLKDGEALFRKQEVELRRQKVIRLALKNTRRVGKHIWFYRRPGVFGLAIVVGFYALWLGKN
ncbi:hypothetical protein CC78DRAFT_419768, partial [Lojkania enalia]